MLVVLTASKATFASASEAISWILVLFASFRMVSNYALVWGKKTHALIWITMDSPYVWSHHLWFTNSDSTQIALHFCEYFINSRLNLEKSKFNSSSLSYCSFPFRPYENPIFLQLRKKISNIFHGFRSSVSDFEQITVSVVKETTKCSSLQEKFLMSDEEAISIK